jgi:hypothetical protein
MTPHLQSSPRTRHRVSLWYALVLWLVLGLAQPGFAQKASPSEYEIKAAMIYRFAQFLEWPTNLFESGQSPLQIGIAGPDPFGNAIDAVLKNQRIGTHDVLIQRHPQPASATNCHLLFISSSLTVETEKLLILLKDKPVLTIGEGEDFAQKGGHIRLYLQDNKLRFDINLAALERSGLKMHSQVLKLATRITLDGKDVKK